LAEPAHFDPRAIRVLFSGRAVAAPAGAEVEALGRLVAEEHPEHRFGEAGLCEAVARVHEQAAADASTPALWVDVEGVDLTGAQRVRIAGGAEGGEADDPLLLDRDDRLRVGGCCGVEVIPPDSLLRLQRVEDLVVDQAPIGDLPRADVDARDVKTLVRSGGSD
jgi:hypothetical protein